MRVGGSIKSTLDDRLAKIIFVPILLDVAGEYEDARISGMDPSVSLQRLPLGTVRGNIQGFSPDRPTSVKPYFRFTPAWQKVERSDIPNAFRAIDRGIHRIVSRMTVLRITSGSPVKWALGH